MSGTGVVDPQVTPPAPSPPAAAPLAPSPAPAPAAVPPQGLLDRIDRLTAEKHELARQKDELERQLTERQPPVPAAPSGVPLPPGGPTPPAAAPTTVLDVERRAQVLAQEIAAKQNFERDVNEVGQAGFKAHPEDWQQAVGTLARLDAFTPELFQVAKELGNPHELIYALGKDFNEAARIAALPPAAKGAALASFASKMSAGAARQISQAPAPAPEVVGGSAPRVGRSDDQSMEAWAAERLKEKAARQR